MGGSEEFDRDRAVLSPDPDRATGWTLYLDGAQQSYVDAADPTWLEFEYMRRLGDVVDAVAPTGEAIVALHLGGGALTLPRYVAATRPGSVQRVVERDATLTALVLRTLPMPSGAELRIDTADARAAVGSMEPASFDLLVGDVYDGARIPANLGTVEAAVEFARVLRPGGWYAVNLSDRRHLRYARGQVATLRAVFADVCLLAEPGVLKGRRFGNLVAVAGADLPVGGLAATASRDMFPARLLHGTDLDRFVAGAVPVTDATARRSPAPPGEPFGPDR